MAKELDPREMFEYVARALCPGQSWPAAIADLMGVRLDTIRHWRSGRSHLRPDHFATMLKLINDKRAELTEVEKELRQWLASQPIDSETTSRGGGINPRATTGEVTMEQQKECPECGHKFRGNGWDGIDAHWRSQHEGIMSYEEAWPLIKAGTYKRSDAG